MDINHAKIKRGPCVASSAVERRLTGGPKEVEARVEAGEPGPGPHAVRHDVQRPPHAVAPHGKGDRREQATAWPAPRRTAAPRVALAGPAMGQVKREQWSDGFWLCFVLIVAPVCPLFSGEGDG